MQDIIVSSKTEIIKILQRQVGDCEFRRLQSHQRLKYFRYIGWAIQYFDSGSAISQVTTVHTVGLPWLIELTRVNQTIQGRRIIGQGDYRPQFSFNPKPHIVINVDSMNKHYIVMWFP